MRDFLDDLERRLATLAADETPAPAPVHRPRRRRPLVLGGLTTAIAGVIAGFTLVGTSTADLAILGTPTVDASKVQRFVPKVAERGVDFESAHAFGTPGGPGYVVTNDDRSTVCLVVPDPDAPGSYGSTCGHPLEAVERDGLFTSFPGDESTQRDARTTAVYVLPDGAQDVTVTTGATTSRPRLESGVLVVQVPADSTVRWTAHGRRGEHVIEGPFRGEFGVTRVQCPSGKQVELRLPEGVEAGTPEGQRELRTQLRERCG